MRALLAVMALSLGCGRTELPEEAVLETQRSASGASPGIGAASCTTERERCVRAPQPPRPTTEWLAGSCPAGLACIPEVEDCTGRCPGRCVTLTLDRLVDGTPRVPTRGHCPSCGPCSFKCGGVAGFVCPMNCRGSAAVPIVTDAAGRCEVD
ncbi:MAG: hypothetical protein JNJ54_19760 [Myxococcaceae bacterium]|nr:hypothetical protein [Myxococcaceae bacterium]